MELVSNFWKLFVVSAPWLMLGLLVAGLINSYLPERFLQRHLGEGGFWVTIKAALIGAPMPLCSCGVIPAAVGLRRAGASKSATTAFLVSTPETGVDSVSVSYALLGPFMAVIRPIAAVSSAVVAGVLVGRETNEADSEPAPQSNCCTSQQKQQEVSCCGSKPKSNPGCCDSEKKQPGALSKLQSALAFSFGKLLEDTAKWLMIGLFFAALVDTYVPQSWLIQWGDSIWAMLAVVLISIPMYICATASTPIAAGLLMAGISPGAVLVFMLAGPATNIATLGVVANELGKRAVGAYLTGVIGVALLFGLLTDYLVDNFAFDVTPLHGHEHEILPPWFAQGLAFILLALMLRLVMRYLLSQSGKKAIA